MLNTAISESKVLRSQGNNEKQLTDLINEQNLFKSFFSLFKTWCQHGFVKVFVIGVTPLALSYFTSGFNEATHLHDHPKFSLMNGFTKEDVKRGLKFIQPELTQQEVDFALDFMEKQFNGYRFVPEQKEALFNSTLVLFQLNLIQELKAQSPQLNIGDILSKIPPDRNNSPTQSTFSLLSGLDISDQKLAQLFKLEPISLTKSIQLDYQIDNLNELGKVVDPSPIYSLMFYLGALTHTENSRVRNPELKIPNLVSEEDFIERLKKIFDPKNFLEPLCSDWLKTKNIQPLCEYLSNEIFSGFQNTDVTGGEVAFSSGKGSGIL